MSGVNVSSHLADYAARDPERAAVIVAATGRQLTFRELHADSDTLAHGLVAAGVTRGTRVAVMVPPSLEFFSLTFALFKVAAVPVMIDPGMGMKNLGTCLAEAESVAFIGIAKAHLARRLYGWAKGAITVNAGRTRFFCKHSTRSLREPGSGPFAPPPVEPDETAAILFTSGSTGLAKGVVYTHGIFSAQVELLKQIYGIEPGEVDLCTFPLFALFGPALGMTCIVPTMIFSRPATIDAAKTVAAIENYKVTNMFGSPAVIRRLGSHGAKLPTLRRAISAGAPARLDEVAAFASLLSPGVQLFIPYGATEALPVANVGSDELLATQAKTAQGAGICIGRPVPGVTVHIIPIRDDNMPVFNASTCMRPEEGIGEFVVRGPIVTKQYWKRDEATKLTKMIDPANGETLHRMGDVGYLGDDGRLWYWGRKSQRVETKDGPLFPDEIEAVFNALGKGFRTALVGVPRANRIEPVIVCEPRPGVDIVETLQRATIAHLLAGRIYLFLLYDRPLFPVDPRHNSKINREQLAAWAAEQLRKTK